MIRAEPSARLRRPRSRRSARRLVAYALAFLTLFVGLSVGGFYYMLSQGPIAVPAIGARIGEALERTFGDGYDFTVGDTVIEQGPRGPILRVTGLRLVDRRGRLIFNAPRADVSIDPLSLAMGDVAPKRLELYDVEMRLDVLPDGAIAVAAGDGAPIVLTLPGAGAPDASDTTPAAPARVADGAAAVVKAVLDTVTDPANPFATMERFGVARGRLVFTDRQRNHTTIFDGFEIALDKSGGTSGRLVMSADGPKGRWSVTADAVGAAGEARELEVDVRDLTLEEIALAAGLRDRVVTFDMPISARLRFALSADQRLATASGRFSFGAGYFHVDDPDYVPFLIDEIVGGFRWDPATREIIVEPTQMLAGETQLSVAGRLVPPQPGAAIWSLELASRDNALAAPEAGEKPLAIDRLAIRATFDSARKRVDLTQLQLDGREAAVNMSATYQAGEGGPALSLDARAERMPARSFVRLWPHFIASKTRAWLLRHLSEGTLESGAVIVDLKPDDFAAIRTDRPLPDGAVGIDFSLSDVTLEVLEGAPPIVGLSGKGRATGRTVGFNATKGEIDVGAGKRLSIPEASFSVPDLGGKSVPAQAQLRVRGTLDAVAALLSREALKPYADLPLDPARIKGDVDGRLVIDLRLGSEARDSDTQTRAQARIANLTIEEAVGTEDLVGATLDVTVDKTGLRGKGEGRLFGATATIELKKPAGQAGEALIGMTFDEATRARRGYAIAGVSGPVGVRLSAPLARPAKGRQAAQRGHVELDLTRASLDGAFPGLSKPAGRAAKATFQYVETSNGATLDQIVLDSGSLSVRGQVSLDADGGFQSARLSQFRVSPGDDMRVTVERGRDGYKVSARGNAWDARPILRAVNQGGDGGARDLEIDLKATLLTGHNKQAISGADARFERRGGQLRAFQLSGRFGRDALTVQAGPRGGFAVRTQDAGALLGFLDLYGRMEGGDLSANVQMVEGRLDGVVTINRFVLRDEPAIRRLVAESAQGQGANPSPTRIDPTRVAFTRVHGQFARTGGRLTIRDGSMYGPNIGLTLDGTIDFGQDRLSLAGTFVPAFTVNNFFSKIPLFGPILTGGSNEGLFGVNFRVAGSWNNPSLTVNPLSAIAPGFLRKIFGVMDGRASAVSDAPSPPGVNAPAVAPPRAPERTGGAR